MVARSFSSEEYQNMQKDSLTLETRDADEISRLIEKKLEEYESVPDNEIQAVEFSCQPVRLKEKLSFRKRDALSTLLVQAISRG